MAARTKRDAKTLDTYQSIRRHFEEQGRADGHQKGLVEGARRGLAEAVLLVLAGRSLDAGTEVRARVLSCDDRGLLERWLARALEASSSDQIFADS